MRFEGFVIAAIAGMFGVLAGPASADLEFVFTDAGFAAGSGPFGTVLLHQFAANEVEVTVSLDQPCCGYVNTGLESFTFSLAASIPQLTGASFTSMTSGFAFSSTVPFGGNDGAGNFQYGIDCTTACGQGGNAPYTGALHFFVTATGLLETSFIGNGAEGTSGNWFSADICSNIAANGQCTQGFTGVVWTGPGTPPPPPQEVPEPQTLALLALGLFGLGLIRSQSRV